MGNPYMSCHNTCRVQANWEKYHEEMAGSHYCSAYKFIFMKIVAKLYDSHELW
jgi:hypothetical protein